MIKSRMLRDQAARRDDEEELIRFVELLGEALLVPEVREALADALADVLPTARSEPPPPAPTRVAPRPSRHTQGGGRRG